MLPAGYAGLVEPKNPAAAAAALQQVARSEDGLRFRRASLERFGLDAHLERLARVIRSAGHPGDEGS
jgi:glycosyltransferase involved in cell wall biosynthesis